MWGRSGRQPSGFLRYLWERSGSRTVRVTRPVRLGDATAQRIAAALSYPARPRLSICIPTTDRLDLLVPCLKSLAETCAASPVEVIIGDTDSRAPTRAVLERLGLRTVHLRGPFNFARACNAMATAARGERLLFLNSDTGAETQDWVDRLLEASEDQVVGAALVYPGSRRLQHAGVGVLRITRPWEPSAYPSVRRWDAPGLALCNLAQGRPVATLSCEPVEVLAVTGAFLSTSRRRFDLLRGFDERYEVDLQDIDYCLRARADGMRVICRSDIVFSHVHSGTRGRYRFPRHDWARFLNMWGEELSR
jgi:GT2 family glycosyltransferase